MIEPTTVGASDLSGAAEADTHLAAGQQHRDAALAVGKAQHLRQGLGILGDIPKNDRETLFVFSLPGSKGERSGLFAEDGDLLGHAPPP
jgi:hypothetical protein